MPRLSSKVHRLRFGARLRQLREERGLTHQELADRTGGAAGDRRNSKWLGAIERGEGNPTLDSVMSLAHALGIAVSELFVQLAARRGRAGAARGRGARSLPEMIRIVDNA